MATVILGNSGNTDAEKSSRFCPVAGMVSSSLHMTDEVQGVLAFRLRVVAMLLFGAFAAFLLHSAWSGYLGHPVNRLMLGVHAAVTIALLGSTLVLFQRKCMGILHLRILELLVFGIPAAFFVWMQFRWACHYSALPGAGTTLHALISETSIPWIMLIFVYALFIPNGWGRASTIIGAMAAAPLLVTLVTAFSYPAMADILFTHGYFSMQMLWLGIAAVSAVLGSHAIGMLRRQAVAARQLGSYHLIRKLGAGGMGEVYLAEHKLLKRPCAIKLIDPRRASDPQAIARFEEEVQSTARLTHWNTVEIYDYGHTEDGTFYYAMEYLPGLNLQELVDRFGPMPAARARHFLRQVCSALREAHSIGLIHRDIKPGNIFAAQRGGIFDVAKLLDFGLVKSTNGNHDDVKLTNEGIVVGSPLYAAPEHATGEVESDARTDIYSLGAVGYFLLTGRPVFVHERPLKVLFAHVNEPVTPPSRYRPGLSPELEAVILRCLNKEPADRFQSAAELDEALAGCDIPDWCQSDACDWWQRAGQVEPDPAITTKSNSATIDTAVYVVQNA